MIIVITLPYFFDGEAERIVSLLNERRADLIHIRKLTVNSEDCQQHLQERNLEVRRMTMELLTAIPRQWRSRLVLHDDHDLAEEFGLYGVHLNSRNPHAPKEWKGSVSRSCHSLEEVEEWKKKCNYVSLSPIYDSISKKGYRSAFTRQDILQASKVGIIDHKVMALGGVTFSRLEEVKQMGFGGAMILGDAWK